MKRRAAILIIAEAGVNHNGSLRLARRLVDAAAAAGADAVKFQTFRTQALASATVPKAAYQRARTGEAGGQAGMLERLELDERAHLALAAHCRERGVVFLSTPYDEESVVLLVRRVGVPLLKISSGELTNGPLLLSAARTRKPIILSTGMGDLREVAAALGVIAFGYSGSKEPPSRAACRAALASPAGRRALAAKLTLLHCTTEYPAPLAEANLMAMDTLREEFGVRVGLSDHTVGVVAPIAAAARGAAVIEKHFTLDRGLPGPDHAASLEPAEFKAMVAAVRDVERALGSGRKVAAPSERKNIPLVRRCIVASRAIGAGERFTPENIACKRAGAGLSPMRYWETVGRKAARRYRKDEVIRP